MCHYILLKDGGSCSPAKLENVMCFIPNGSNYTTVHFLDKSKSEQCGNLGLWISRVERKTKSFIRIDRSRYVNTDAIVTFSRAGGILFKSGLRIDLTSDGFIALAWFYEWGEPKEENKPSAPEGE